MHVHILTLQCLKNNCMFQKTDKNKNIRNGFFFTSQRKHKELDDIYTSNKTNSKSQDRQEFYWHSCVMDAIINIWELETTTTSTKTFCLPQIILYRNVSRHMMRSFLKYFFEAFRETNTSSSFEIWDVRTQPSLELSLRPTIIYCFFDEYKMVPNVSS